MLKTCVYTVYNILIIIIDDVPRISKLDVPDLDDLENLEDKNKESKEIGVGRPRISFSLLRYRISELWELCEEKTFFYSIGDGCIYSVVEVITCLVTFPTFVEIRG